MSGREIVGAREGGREGGVGGGEQYCLMHGAVLNSSLFISTM